MMWFPVAAVIFCLATPALAQQLPPLDPAVQLGVCQQQRAMFLADSEQELTWMRQFLAEIADLKKRLAKAEAKARPEGQPAPPKVE